MAPGHGDILMAQDNRRPVRRHSTMVTRERLIRAAAELMAERLSIDVSLSEIAQRSGLSAGLVQYHFGGKEELLLAVADWVLESSTQKTRELAASGISPREKLSGFIRGLVLLYRDFPFLTHLTIFLTSRGTPEENAAMSRRLIQPVVDVLDAMLEEGRNSGASSPFQRLMSTTCAWAPVTGSSSVAIPCAISSTPISRLGTFRPGTWRRFRPSSWTGLSPDEANAPPRALLRSSRFQGPPRARRPSARPRTVKFQSRGQSPCILQPMP